jgi:acetylornithine deacetylase
MQSILNIRPPDALEAKVSLLVSDPLDPDLMSSLLAELVGISSVSGQEDLATFMLANALEVSGLAVTRMPVDDKRQNLLICFGEPKVLLTSHIDTPSHPAQVSGIKDGLVYGRGACDAKGQIVAMLAGCLALKRMKLSGFGLLIVVGEEDGGVGAKAALSDLRYLNVRYLVNGEPTNNKLVTIGRGCIDIDVSFCTAPNGGRSMGTDANTQAVNFLQRLLQVRLPSHPLLGDSNVNVGLIHGGQGRSVPSSSCKVGLCFRCVSPTSDAIELVHFLAPTAQIAIGYRCEPCELMTLPGCDCDVALFGSDIGIFKQLNCKMLMIGPGSISNAHKADEFLSISELAKEAELHVRIVKELLSQL